MLYFARHLEVVAGVAPEAAPLESFGVEEHHCVARLATVSARTGPECRAHPCLLLSATAARCLPAYGPRRLTGAGHVLPRRGFPPHLGNFWWPWIRRAARLQRDLPPTPPRPSAGLDPHPASPQATRLVQAGRWLLGGAAGWPSARSRGPVRLQAWFQNQHPRSLRALFRPAGRS